MAIIWKCSKCSYKWQGSLEDHECNLISVTKFVIVNTCPDCKNIWSGNKRHKCPKKEKKRSRKESDSEELDISDIDTEEEVEEKIDLLICNEPGCNRRPYHGLEHEGATHCFEHKDEDMVRSKSRCIIKGCTINGSFKYSGKTYCAKHKYYSNES